MSAGSKAGERQLNRENASSARSSDRLMTMAAVSDR